MLFNSPSSAYVDSYQFPLTVVFILYRKNATPLCTFHHLAVLILYINAHHNRPPKLFCRIISNPIKNALLYKTQTKGIPLCTAQINVDCLSTARYQEFILKPTIYLMLCVGTLR